MSVKIRLSRGGTKKRPYYYVVVADSASPRDGRYIEQIGTHNPLLAKDNAERVKLNIERVKHWLSRRRAADRPRGALHRRGGPRQAHGAATTPTRPSRRRSAWSARRPRPKPRPRRPKAARPSRRRKPAVAAVGPASSAAHSARPHRRRAWHSRRGADPRLHRAAGEHRAPTDRCRMQRGARSSRSRALRVTPKGVVARLAGVADRNAAEALKGVELYVERERLPPAAEGEFYHADLIGLTAVDRRGQDASARSSPCRTSAPATCWRSASPARRETELVPFTDAFVPEVDIAARRSGGALPMPDESRRDGEASQSLLGRSHSRRPGSAEIASQRQWPCCARCATGRSRSTRTGVDRRSGPAGRAAAWGRRR